MEFIGGFYVFFAENNKGLMKILHTKKKLRYYRI
jgi:hypothetical protein